MGCSYSGVGGSVVKPIQYLTRQEGGVFIVLGVSASSPWRTFTPLLPPLTPLSMRGRLRERLLPALGRDDRDALAVTQVLPQLWWRVSFSIPLLHQRSIDATLLAAHQLVNNPPPSEASPSATEQWCHDIDQLIVAAINTPP
jgi:hypothetical protein